MMYSFIYFIFFYLWPVFLFQFTSFYIFCSIYSYMFHVFHVILSSIFNILTYISILLYLKFDFVCWPCILWNCWTYFLLLVAFSCRYFRNFYIDNYDIYKWITLLLSFAYVCFLFSFLALIELARISSIMVNMDDNYWLVLDLGVGIFSFSKRSMMLTVTFLSIDVLSYSPEVFTLF